MSPALRQLADVLKEFRPGFDPDSGRTSAQGNARAFVMGSVAVAGASFVAAVWAHTPWRGADVAAREASLAAGLAASPAVFSVHAFASALMILFFFSAGLGIRQRVAGRTWENLKESARRPSPLILFEIAFALSLAAATGWLTAVLGLAAGLAIPGRSSADAIATSDAADVLLDRYDAASDAGDDERCSEIMARLSALSRRAESPADRLQWRITPGVVFGVLPFFAWAHGGVWLAVVAATIAGGAIALTRDRSLA